MRRSLLTATFVAAMGVLTLGTQTAQAAVICSGCEYLDPATYLGAYDPTAFDSGTFMHQEVPEGTVIDDFWVFDVAPSGDGSTSADFTVAAPFSGFTGGVYADAGSNCVGAAAGDACTSVSFGALLFGDTDPSEDRFATGLIALDAGRYIIRIQGTAGEPFGTYTGQLAVLPSAVPEPAMLTLLGFGLATAGTVARRRRRS